MRAEVQQLSDGQAYGAQCATFALYVQPFGGGGERRIQEGRSPNVGCVYILIGTRNQCVWELSLF